MKKIALRLMPILLLFLALAGIQTLKVAKANPIPYPTEPSQEYPTIEINNPNNGDIFTKTTVEVNFTVTKPNSWNEYWLTTMPVIGSYVVYVHLDGNNQSTFLDPGSTGFPNANYSVYLNKLSRGAHSVEIEVEAFTYYKNPNPEQSDYLTNTKTISKTIHFTVSADIPTPTPTQNPNSQPQSFPTTLVFIASVGIALAVIGLLVYFKKCQRGRTQ